jgi:hypothetical protein
VNNVAETTNETKTETPNRESGTVPAAAPPLRTRVADTLDEVGIAMEGLDEATLAIDDIVAGYDDGQEITSSAVAAVLEPLREARRHVKYVRDTMLVEIAEMVGQGDGPSNATGNPEKPSASAAKAAESDLAKLVIEARAHVGHLAQALRDVIGPALGRKECAAYEKLAALQAVLQDAADEIGVDAPSFDWERFSPGGSDAVALCDLEEHAEGRVSP